MLRFTLFRIPIVIEPWFWLTAFLISGGFQAKSREGLTRLLIVASIIFISILVHELGHALTSRKLTGKNPSIKLWAMGGLAYPNTSLTRKQSFWVTWAGPLAGFALFILTCAVCLVLYGPSGGVSVIQFHLSKGTSISSNAPPAIIAIGAIIWINFWWSIINLLPVHPLDGGQIYASMETDRKKVHLVGTITGALVAIAAIIFFQKIFLAILFGFLAYQNYQAYQQANSGWR